MAKPTSASSFSLFMKVGGWWDKNDNYRGGKFIHGGLMAIEGFSVEKVVSKIVELTDYDRTIWNISFSPDETDGKLCFLKEDVESKLLMDKVLAYCVKYGYFIIFYAVRADDPYLGDRKVVEEWDLSSPSSFYLSIWVGGWWDKKNRYCGGEVIQTDRVESKDFSVEKVISKIVELTKYDRTMSNICFWPGGRDEKIRFLKEDMESKLIMDKEIAAAVERGFMMSLYAVREDDPYIGRRKAVELGVTLDWSDASSISSFSEDGSYDGSDGFPDGFDGKYDDDDQYGYYVELHWVRDGDV